MARTTAVKSPAKRAQGRPRGACGPQKPKPGSGTLLPGEVLTIKGFMDRMGVSYGGVRRMIDRGLKVRVDGRYRRIRTEDYSAYLESLPTVPAR